MVINIERPFDFLDSLKGKDVIVYVKDEDDLHGSLVAFDVHINLVILLRSKSVSGKRVNFFVKGDSVVFVGAADGTD